MGARPMIVITTALYAGTPSEAADRADSFYCEDPVQAVHAIKEGATAFIPLEKWEATATEVLQALNATKEQIKFAIHFAKTGNLPEGSIYAW